MGAFVLSEAESCLARDVGEGIVCDFSKNSGPRPEIRAEAIRRLLLGLEVTLDGNEQAVTIRPPGTGIHLRYANISGSLNLENAWEPSGSALQALAMENCVIPEKLQLSRARLRSLSFEGTRLTNLNARDLHIEGSLNLTGVRSAEPDGSGSGVDKRGLCYIELHRAHICGGIDAQRGAFVAPTKRDGIDKSASCTYAFDIRSAHIRDSVLLENGVTAIGGVCFEDAIIGGDIRARGGRFVAVEEYAINGNAARIEGHLFLSHYVDHKDNKTDTIIEGELRLLGIRIDGDLRIVGAVITDGDAKNRGDVILSKAHIGSRLTVKGVKLARKADDEPGITHRLLISLSGILKYPWVLSHWVFWPLLRRWRVRDPLVELRGAKVGVLDDDDGKGFVGRYLLQVEGFEYARIMMGRAEKERSLAENRGKNAPLKQKAERGRTRSPIDSMEICFTSIRLLAWLTFVWGVVQYALECIGFLRTPWIELFWGFPWLAPVHGVVGTTVVVACAGIVVLSAFLALSDLRFTQPHWRARRKWLDHQFKYYWSYRNTLEYDPSPYEHLSRVLRNQGLFEDARRIASIRLTLESKLRTPAIFRPSMFMYRVCFDYGLSSVRAVMTLLICIVIGTWFVGWADYGFQPRWTTLPGLTAEETKPFLALATVKPVLIVHASAVNNIAGGENGRKIPVFTSVSATSGISEEKLLCGDRIEPLLYAIDIFIPALDLQQEMRCIISTRANALEWRVARAAYALLGWVVVSLTILTISGVLRRQAEG